MASYKFYTKDEDGAETRKVTESHPNTSASQDDLRDALKSVADMYGESSSRVVLNSDTTVFTAA